MFFKRSAVEIKTMTPSTVAAIEEIVEGCKLMSRLPSNYTKLRKQPFDVYAFLLLRLSGVAEDGSLDPDLWVQLATENILIDSVLCSMETVATANSSAEEINFLLDFLAGSPREKDQKACQRLTELLGKLSAASPRRAQASLFAS